MHRILTLNLGTGSSKVGLFEDDSLIDKRTINHSDEELSEFVTMKEQLEYRKGLILKWLEDLGYSMADIDAIGLRVGTLPRKVGGGTFLIEGLLERDLMEKYFPNQPLPHGSRIVVPLAKSLSRGHDIKFYLTDPATMDELLPEAKISGHSLIERDTTFHALNHKMVAREAAKTLNKKYEDCNFVVAHMGGGVSVAAHNKGRVVEVNNCDAEEGCFSPTRTGDLPARKLIKLCYSGKYTFDEMFEMTKGKGGVYSYLGTSDMLAVEKRIQDNDKEAELVFKAMAYRVAKDIGSCYAVLCGKVDMIILTGGIANSSLMIDSIKSWVQNLAPIYVYPGELESEALAAGALRVLRGEENVAQYPKPD